MCTSNTTPEVRGNKSVPIVGKGKQKQITGTFTVSADGDFLPMQLIYAGKTDRFHPNGINFPEGFNISHTPNHRSCEKSAIEHLEKWYSLICQRNENSLKWMPKDQKALLIFDVFKGQTTQQVKYVILLFWQITASVFVPRNLTNHFQQLDLNVNGQAKQFLKRKFES